MRYEEIRPITRYEAVLALRSNDPDAIVLALLSSALHDPDWRWVQGKCFRFAHHTHPAVRGIAALSLGHLARIHRTLDQTEAEQILARLLKDPDKSVAGRANDALQDLRFFLKPQSRTGAGAANATLGVEWPYAWRLVDLPELVHEVRVLSEEEDRTERDGVVRRWPEAMEFRGTVVIQQRIDELSAEEVVESLLQLRVDLREPCRVFWAPPVRGLELPTESAFRHFCDLWYPGSDDMWVVNQAHTWVLECNHEGVLRFATGGTRSGKC